VTVPADVDQLEQVLINLVKNAAEASLPTQGRVRIGWRSMDRFVELAIEDEGPGVGDTTNLFVPFFTTKPDGSGIGLVLCREIVEAHEGRMSLATRPEGRGAVARVRLPLGE
jgi:signal transduction histidine kinase